MSSEPIDAGVQEPGTAEPRTLTALDRKIVQHFPGLVVRKDLTNGLKQNAVVPTYVLEYLLGQHCATDDPEVIRTGLESVRRILARHYVHRNEAELVKSTIKEKGRHKVIDKVTVELNEKGGFYEAEFTNLGIKKVPISDDFVRRYPKLLVGGIWTITDVTYEVGDDPKSSPWQIDTLKPIQVAGVSQEEYLTARAQFTTEEWMDALMQSVGFNPEMFGRRAKLLVLTRLIPYCERNYNLIELGPKGTGKSHVYAEFSPHGMLISGSDVTAPKLFVNNNNGRIGLVGYWDCLCFDEFAGKDKRIDKALVDIMKNYMANRTFSRGIEQLSAEASMVFMGNTQKSVAYMLKHSHFFDPLPDKYVDSAFLDRIHAFNPGWEVAPIRHELFTGGYGFIVDYLAEVLKQLRTEDFTSAYKEHFEIVSEVSTRDQTGFEKTFSGLMKILYPHGEATAEEIGELLSFAMEARRRVREHILRIDDTFARHDFEYRPVAGGATVVVRTPEEVQYPTFAGPRARPGADPEAGAEAHADAEPALVGAGAPGGAAAPLKFDPDAAAHAGADVTAAPGAPAARAPGSGASGAAAEPLLEPTHIVVPENTRGWSYRRLFAPYLENAREITVRDPYIRLPFQIRNLIELLQVVHELVPEGDEVRVHLVTAADSESAMRQEEMLNTLASNLVGSRIAFSWEVEASPHFHARSITTDTGWKIALDRGLDIFQKFEGGFLSVEQTIQEARLTKGTDITFVRV